MNQKTSKLLQQLLNGLLVAVVIGLIGFLSLRYKAEIDWTAGGRNTLTAASQKLLKEMPDPVKFTAFLYPDSENRRDIEMWVKRYQRVKPDIEIEYVDPSKDPAKVKEYKVDQPGEVVVEYQGRKETLRVLSETAVTGALQRLMDTGEHYVVFLEGHGEHSINKPGDSGEENASDLGYDQFVDALRQKGLKVQGLNLVKNPSIPDNTSVLVVASPEQKLLDGEIKIIDDYIKAGGNLLWLNDPGKPNIDAMAKTLGINWYNGFVIFPEYEQLGSSSPMIYFATDYPANPITQDLAYVTEFPLARPFDWDKDADRTAGWDVLPLLDTTKDSWMVAGAPSSQADPNFNDKRGDKRGPLTFGITLSRPVKAEAAKDAVGKPADSRTQRVAVLGDSDFLADGVLDQQGNRQFGLNLVQWLASRDAMLNIDVPKAPDTALFLQGWQVTLIVAFFVPVLPILLLGYGITRWARRRRR
jgi:ABC-type uncharacterized transport system involved in gliding motility auxiliary subunit